MPNKTIYIKEADVSLFEQAQEQLGDSVSSMFSEFLRDRVSTLNPGEAQIHSLIGHLGTKREALKHERDLPAFIDAIYAEAESHAEKSLKRVKAGKARDAKIEFWTASSFVEMAERNLKQVREIGDKLGEMRRLD